MTLINGNCLEVMKDISNNSIDLLFCDLPYGQTSCKWDCLIDLELFWKQVNRICKDDTAMFFTCSTKFGVALINSNPKNFRYDLVWVKSSPCGFLNAKKMPMKKHEMVYVFYKKLPKIYTDNIAQHHTHKFIKETANKRKSVKAGEHLYGDSKESPIGKYDPPLPTSVIKDENLYIRGKETNNNNEDVYNSNERINNGKLYHHPRNKQVGSESIYDPPLPTSVIKDEKTINTLYGGEHAVPDYVNKRNKKTGMSAYDPPLPTSVIKNDDYEKRIIKERNTIKKEENYGKEYLNKKENFRAYNPKLGAKGEDGFLYDPPLPTSVIRNTADYKNESEMYGNIVRTDCMRKNNESMYDPPLPTSVIKDEKTQISKCKDKDLYGDMKGGTIGNVHGTNYEPPLPNTILEIASQKGKHSTQKPVDLIKWCLKYYSKEGDTILDPTMGSGSTGVACNEMNRKFIGIEMDETIFKVAEERVNV